MKSKLKIIIPTVLALIAIIIAVLCIKFTPNETVDFDSLMSTAQKYLIEQNYEQAIAEFEKIIELDPQNADAYLGLAEAYAGMGETDKAVEILEKGISETNSDTLSQELDELLDSMKTSVPDISDLSRDEIEDAFSEQNIKYTIKEEYNSKIPAGGIISDNIPENRKIGENDTIEVVISLGIEKVKVPNFTNLLYSDAEKLAKETGLNLSVKESYSKETEAEHIISQLIPPDTEVAVGTNVFLEVSLGVEMVTVPDLIGLTREEAEKVINENKLYAEFVEEYSDNIEKGSVISQSINANTQTETETIIKIEISKGKKVLSKYFVSELTKPTREKEAYGYVFQYDDNGQLIQVTEYWDKKDWNQTPTRVFTYSYSDIGNNQIKIVRTKTQSKEITTSEYIYDKSERALYDPDVPESVKEYPRLKINDDDTIIYYDITSDDPFAYDTGNWKSEEKNIGFRYAVSSTGETFNHYGWPDYDPTAITGIFKYDLLTTDIENINLLDMNRLIIEYLLTEYAY